MHPRPPSSIHVHPAPPSSFQPPPSSLEYLRQYLNQNVARNWAISPNLGQKIKSCPFWLKIGTHGILEVLIPNPDLDFWNSDPKIHFWANLGPKIQSCSLCLKIGAQSVLRMLIPDLELDFLNFDPKIHFLAHLGWKSHSCPVWLTQSVSTMLILIPTLFFSVSNPKSFLDKFGPKNLKLFILTEHWYTGYIEDADSYSDNGFLNFQP